MTTTEKTIEYDSQLSSCITEHLYLNELHADFRFTFELSNGNHEHVPVHKALLSAMSAVFNEKFHESENKTIDTNIDDVSIDAFKEFLQFFYLPKVKMTTKNVAQVMNLGRKYKIVGCISICKQFLQSILTDDNACWIYGLAINWNESELQQFCEEHIKRNTKPVLSSNTFLVCDRNVLSHIVKLDCLLCREVDIFAACLNWVKATSNQEHLSGELIRKRLDDSFYDICFGSMSVAKFIAFNDAYDGLFAAEEHAEILQMITSKDVQPKIFRTNRRKCFKIEWDEEVAIHCRRLFWNKSIKPYYVKNIDTTTFSSNKSLWLGNIICQILLFYRGKNEYDEDQFETVKEDVPTEVTIVEMASDRLDDRAIVYMGNAVLEAERDRDHTNITLQQPILIKPGYLYEIQMKQSLPDAVCTHYPLMYEVEIEPGIFVTFHNVTFEDEDRLTRGLIPGLKFIKV